MNSHLLIPMHVDGLYLEKGRHGVQAFADFSNLPWVARSSEGEFEQNAQNPFLSSSVNTQPLSDSDFWLKPGIHLHWSLPMALATASKPLDPKQGKELKFPAAPDRWLVVKWTGSVRQESWLIESDYLWSPDDPLLSETWITLDAVEEAFPNEGSSIWKILVDRGWLNPLPQAADAAVVVEPGKRKSDRLGKYESKRRAIEQALKFRAHADTRQWQITYPVGFRQREGIAPSFQEQPGEPPFRYLGRCRALGASWLQGVGGGYLKQLTGQPLTAVGYGEPAFAGFYPNCRTVFGHYDPVEDPPASQWYEVFGWYDDPQDDPLRQFVTAFQPSGRSPNDFVRNYEAAFGTLRFKLSEQDLSFLPELIPDPIHEKLKNLVHAEFVGRAAFEKAVRHAAGNVGNSWDAILNAALPEPSRDAPIHPHAELTATQVSDALQEKMEDLFEDRLREHFGWTRPDDTKPDRVLCYGRVHQPGFVPPATQKVSDLDVAVANSGVEAVSALVASQLADERYPDNHEDREQEKRRIERYLQALEVTDAVEGHKLDIGAKLDVARQAKTFSAHPGSSLWIIHPRVAEGNNRQADAEQTHLPLWIGHALNALNAAQHAYDQSRNRVESLRWQIYSDWYRYMQNAYPSGGEARDFVAARSDFKTNHDVDVMIDFLRRSSLTELFEAEMEAGEVLGTEAGSMQARYFLTIATNAVDASVGWKPVSADFQLASSIWSRIGPDPAHAEARLAARFADGTNTANAEDLYWNLKSESGEVVSLAVRDGAWVREPSGSRLPLSRAQDLLQHLEAVRRAIHVHNVNPPQVVYSVETRNLLAKAALHGLPAFSTKELDKLEPLKNKAFKRGEQQLLVDTIRKECPELSDEQFSILWAKLTPQWVLDSVPGPRFYEPNNPVVLLAGTAAKPRDNWELNGTRFHDEHGRLACRALALDGELDNLIQAKPRIEQDLLNALVKTPLRLQLEQCAQSWRMEASAVSGSQPVLLEWQAEVAPVRSKGNLTTDTRRYDPSFLENNWQLGEDNFVLTEKTGLATLTNGIGSFRGRSLITSHARQIMASRLETYILRRLAEQNVPVSADGEVLSLWKSRELPVDTVQMKSWFDLYAPDLAKKSASVQADRIQSRLSEIGRWILARRMELDLYQGAQALQGMQQVKLPTRLKVDRVHGLPENSLVATGICSLVNDCSVDELVKKVGLDSEHAAALRGQNQVYLYHTLGELLQTRKGAEPFLRLLWFADAYGYIRHDTDPEQVLSHAPVWGLPDGGAICYCILDVVNNVDANVLIEADLSANAVEAIIDIRAIAPLASLSQLNALPAITLQTFARLLAYACVKGKLQAGAYPGKKKPDDKNLGELAWEDQYGHEWVDPLLTAFSAWCQLLNYPNVLTQSLDGFNDALLMRRTAWQLPVSDPMGFEFYKSFTGEVVRPAVADANHSAPEVLNDFHPLRSGDLGLTSLRLVDVFGQWQELDVTKIVTTEQMSTDRPLAVTLPPRFTQPARLQFRWLDAEQEEAEWNTHPDTTPICGWLAANNLDSSLVLYDNLGQGLGSIDRMGRWRVPPGKQAPAIPADIDNPHLRRMAEFLCKKGRQRVDQTGETGQSFIDAFVGVVESSLENISPETSVQSQARALLMSRPLALVRASFNLELRDPPAVQQSLIALKHELQGAERDTSGFEQVRVPVRIGEHLRFQDGVIGYWIDGPAGYQDEILYTPQSSWVRDETLKVYRRQDGAFNLSIALAGSPTTVSVLMEPHGSLHATCGLLPPKQLTIPADQYIRALKNLQVSFLTAPLLTDRDRIHIVLPEEPGWNWNWLANEGDQWSHLPARPIVQLAEFMKAFPGKKRDGRKLWASLVQSQALAALPGHDGVALLKRENLNAALEAIEKLTDLDEGISADVKHFLDLAARSIEKPYTEARFQSQELREGWLTLSRDSVVEDAANDEQI